MPAHRLSMPPSRWPEPLRDRFLKAFATATRSQRPRLEQAFGRWLLAAEKDRLPPERVTPALVNARTAGLRPATATAMRQAVQAVFPAAIVFAPTERVVCGRHETRCGGGSSATTHASPEDGARCSCRCCISATTASTTAG